MKMNQDERRFDFHGLGAALKRAREEKGWTQAYVAEIVSILLGIFGIYQLIVLPIYIWYIWYLMIYLDEFKNIVVMLTFEIVYICIYIILAWLCKKTLVVYILLFLLALLIFR